MAETATDNTSTNYSNFTRDDHERLSDMMEHHAWEQKSWAHPVKTAGRDTWSSPEDGPVLVEMTESEDVRIMAYNPVLRKVGVVEDSIRDRPEIAHPASSQGARQSLSAAISRRGWNFADERGKLDPAQETIGARQSDRIHYEYALNMYERAMGKQFSPETRDGLVTDIKSFRDASDGAAHDRFLRAVDEPVAEFLSRHEEARGERASSPEQSGRAGPSLQSFNWLHGDHRRLEAARTHPAFLEQMATGEFDRDIAAGRPIEGKLAEKTDLTREHVAAISRMGMDAVRVENIADVARGTHPHDIPGDRNGADAMARFSAKVSRYAEKSVPEEHRADFTAMMAEQAQGDFPVADDPRRINRMLKTGRIAHAAARKSETPDKARETAETRSGSEAEL